VSILSPLPYHYRVRDFVQGCEPALWRWFASDAFADEYVESVRLELLKSTYRMHADAHPALYAAAAQALRALELELPVAFYQAQEAQGMNAALCFLPGEAHVVLQGPILATLNELELTALVAHELAHYKLWTEDDGSHRTTMNLVEALAQHPNADPSHVNTAQRLRRYTELYADRGALLATQDPLAAISCLVKIHTGLREVEARGYLAQAEEVLRRGAGAAKGDTHPEGFIRARALSLWHERASAADAEIAALIQELRTLDDLDLLDQLEATALTRSVIESLLQPAWFRTERVLGHARLFFADFAPTSEPAAPQRLEVHDALLEYIAYVLLDFAVADPQLGEVALGYTLQASEQLGCAAAFEKAARKELKLTPQQLAALKQNATSMLERAASQRGPAA
jgi:predicted SprT family Zn-dependent metalloprotease